MTRFERWMAAAGVAVIVAGAALWSAIASRRPPGVTVIPGSGAAGQAPVAATAPGAGAPTDAAAKPAQVIVHVAGAVKSPGVYRLPTGARVDDAVKAAGGALAKADTDAVNLAAPLQDGTQVYLPVRGVAPADRPVAPEYASGGSGAAASPDTAGTPPDAGSAPAAGGSATRGHGRGGRGAHGNKLRDPGQGVVHLNSASSADLQRLPGVGPAIAARILAYRQSAGGFHSAADLRRVSGIGPKKFAEMEPFVRVP